MGLMDRLAGRRVYLDSNVFIYAFEDVPEFSAVCELIFAALRAGKIGAVTSEIAIAEILVLPLSEGLIAVARKQLDTLDTTPGLEIAAVDRKIVLGALAVRATRKIKLPDAIHMSTAAETGCEAFITADRSIRSAGQIEIVYLDAAQP